MCLPLEAAAVGVKLELKRHHGTFTKQGTGFAKLMLALNEMPDKKVCL